MDEFESLIHSEWWCNYHVVFISKCRRRTLYAELRYGQERRCILLLSS